MSINLYPYAQITRNKKPDDVMGFYILHEGFIGVFDGELQEDDYDDIEEKIVRNAKNGWLGITDKYWVTAVVPTENQNFKSTFLYKNNFRANYIQNTPIVINSKSSSSNEVRLFVAAKEVETVDGYAESEGIEKFDLTIDWGWFYFFTKPLFFVIDYLFKLSGNFGVAIVLITLAIRIVFFPLANYSFRSMAKMKAVQPEMTRLKELHKEDKVKLQQEMMALYRKEKINPASGCLPILIQIPFFFAIYKMLFISLEMRHQLFFGWIQDLSAKDPTTIFNLFGLIPWSSRIFDNRNLADTYGIDNVFATKVKSCSSRSNSGKNFCFFSVISDNNISSISIRISSLLDSQQRFNNCSTMGNNETNKS